MQKLRAALVIVLAALWVGMGSHCLIESMSGCCLLQCTAHPTSSTPGSHCDSDGCQTIESGLYLSVVHNLTPSRPATVFLIEPFSLAKISQPCEPSDVSSTLLKTAPPGLLPPIWLISLRTAMPPRAPSYVS